MFNGRGPEKDYLFESGLHDPGKRRLTIIILTHCDRLHALPTPPPKKQKICPCQILEAVNVTLFRKSVCANVIRLRILRWSHLGLSGWVLNPMTSVLKRKRQSHSAFSAAVSRLLPACGSCTAAPCHTGFSVELVTRWELASWVRAGRESEGERDNTAVCPWSHTT